MSSGCSAFGGVYGKIDEAECQTLIEYSLKKGINYIDTAPWYGNSEEVVGRALKSKNIPRECYYIATKVGNSNLQLSIINQVWILFTLNFFEGKLQFN